MATNATKWFSLPNDDLIAAVVADVKARPKVWHAVEAAIPSLPVSAAVTAAQDAIQDARRGLTMDDIHVTRWTAAWGVVLGLVAWDDCARLLDLPSTTLRTMADLCDAPACHQAMLLLPYVLVKEST
jgi:hypothetical protein